MQLSLFTALSLALAALALASADDALKRQAIICPDIECLLGFFPDPWLVKGDAKYKACIAAGKALVIPGCPYQCVAEEPGSLQASCPSGWALYGPPADGADCLGACIPGCASDACVTPPPATGL